MALICREVVPIDGRKSFYGKALEYSDSDGNIWLKSYNTIVAKIDSSGNLYVRGEYSAEVRPIKRNIDVKTI